MVRVKPGRAYGAEGISGRLSVRPKPKTVTDPKPRGRKPDPGVTRSNVDTEVTGYAADGRVTGRSVVAANRIPRLLRTLALLSDRTVRVELAWNGGSATVDMAEV